MRIANIEGRAHLVVGDGRAVDIEKASDGEFGCDMMDLLDDWAHARSWVLRDDAEERSFVVEQLDAPVPRPRQIFAVGLNYADHVAESGMSVPPEPAVFTKYVTSIVGPNNEVVLPAGNVDWEVETVAVIGLGGRNIAAGDAWDHIAALTVGQDLSERVLQLTGSVPQFSLAKSHEGFSPIGPWLVTPDEFENPDDLALGCSINGEVVQAARTKSLIFSVPVLVEKLSAVAQLLPGDLIFTGTPSGVGAGRTPQRFLKPGDELVSYVEGIGEIRQTFTG